MTEKITRLNGNGKEYTVSIPKIVIVGIINDAAIKHIYDNTGLHFEKKHNTMEAQPRSSNQIVTLLLTYNFKTRYYNNWSTKNTLFLKSDHHVGFDVDSICADCCNHNRINHTLNDGERLSC